MPQHDEVEQRERVPAARMPDGEASARRRDAEADDVRQRVQLAPERRGLCAPARDAPVEHVEDERGRRSAAAA